MIPHPLAFSTQLGFLRAVIRWQPNPRLLRDALINVYESYLLISALLLGSVLGTLGIEWDDETRVKVLPPRLPPGLRPHGPIKPLPYAPFRSPAPSLFRHCL